MRASKGSHKISYHGIEYRWQATGNDGWISVGIWPAEASGPYIGGNFNYHESAGDQIVVTNRLISRIIEYAILKHGYDPQVEAKQLNLGSLEDKIKWDDAVRALRKRYD